MISFLHSFFSIKTEHAIHPIVCCFSNVFFDVAFT